jgi:hypothetical protein
MTLQSFEISWLTNAERSALYRVLELEGGAAGFAQAGNSAAPGSAGSEVCRIHCPGKAGAELDGPRPCRRPVATLLPEVSQKRLQTPAPCSTEFRS